MTAGKLQQPEHDDRNELNTSSPWSLPLKPMATAAPLAVTQSDRAIRTARKRPRTSISSQPSPASMDPAKAKLLPPQPPYRNSCTSREAAITPDQALDLTRPRNGKPGRPSQLPYLGGSRCSDNDGGMTWKQGSNGSGSSSPGTEDNVSAHLSRAARVLEEDRKKVASIRSFLLNFLEDRDCSIKRRLDLYVHQTETGRPVTDAVVQEVCKMRPDMIGLSLRECMEVTDVGLWCIARHTRVLRELNVSGCHGVTNIGLRSLAIRCADMEQLDFTNCNRLTDLGLRVIGGGCWSLKSLSLEGCSKVSDTGVAELAKMSTGLTYLNISRCERVGEYGDRALLQLGRSCHQLKGLDAFGCSHAQDPGLLAVARGCPKLEKLMLTGCGEITGKSVRALARGCSSLQDLSLSGCGGVGNGDLKMLAKGCTSLRHLNIAECAQVNANGLAALASGLKNLTELDVGGCPRVDDSALRALCSMNAHYLNLSGCAAITESGVAGIAANCTALSSLNVTGCPGIGRRFMAELCHSMKLSEPAQDYFGFQPRKNAKELLAMKEARNRRRIAAIMVQAHIRGYRARGRANIVRRNWIVKKYLARAQARIRGYFARKWYRAWRAQVREQRAAAAIQATWRMLGDHRMAERLRRDKIFREIGQSLATKIQAAWWGHRGRVRMAEIRAIRARQLLLETRIQAKRELASIMIQSNLRRMFAKKQLLELRNLRDAALELERRRQAAAVLIQSIARMLEGRAALAVLKAIRDQKILEWEMALKLQAAWRGRAAKMLLLSMRILREEALQKAAAITIQSFWRAVRARHLTTIQRALFKIRQIQGGAAKEIQRVYRGFKGRLRAKARRRVFESDLGREAAAMKIERVFRGHKGRERFECKQHLRLLEEKARPLLHKLEELKQTAAKLSDQIRLLAQASEPLRAEHLTLREELFHIRHTTDKYTDSDKVSGCRQRFLTKFLQVRLAELKKTLEGRLEKLDAEAIDVEVKQRYNTRILRQTERELIPLGKGTVEKVKLMRTARLRQKVRSERSGATTIQRVFRGWRVRSAINSWYRDYWVESKDEATGDVYYVNTWNQEIRWVKPLEISLFENSDGNTSRCGTGSSRLSGVEDDDEDYCDGGVENVGDRFRDRLVELTEEATFAAEEEEDFVRYVAANFATILSDAYGKSVTGTGNDGGADFDVKDMDSALEAAREWTFVCPRKRLPPHSTAATQKCWYHAGTSEYFWGNTPPLRSLYLRRAGSAVWNKKKTPLNDSVSRSTAGTTVSGISEMVEPKVMVDPNLGLMFFHRAFGEAWLKTQDVDALLARSERVCDIGSAGWSQMRASAPSGDSLASGREDGDCAFTVSTVTEGSAVAATKKGGVDANSPGGARTNRRGSVSLPSFSFFYHAQTGEARWCLSPRSALLAARRTSLGEVSNAEQLQQQQQQQGCGEEAVSGASEDFYPVTSSEEQSGSGGDGWELVEDGDVVFYYNRRLGVSSWEPPPGWEVSGGQDPYGAGG